MRWQQQTKLSIMKPSAEAYTIGKKSKPNIEQTSIKDFQTNHFIYKKTRNQINK